MLTCVESQTSRVKWQTHNNTDMESSICHEEVSQISIQILESLLLPTITTKRFARS